MDGVSTETNIHSHTERAKEILNTLPREGVILHGTSAGKSESIKTNGLVKSFNGLIDFFSFQPSEGTPPDNLTAKELNSIHHKFVRSLEENIFWSTQHATLRPFYDESFSDFPDDWIFDNLPAVVVAKRPDNIREVRKQNNRFDWESSDPIPPDNILMIASLTKEEFEEIKSTMSGSIPDLSSYDTNLEFKHRVDNLDNEAKKKVARVFARKILDHFTTKDNPVTPK